MFAVVFIGQGTNGGLSLKIHDTFMSPIFSIMVAADANKWEDGGNLNQPLENMGFVSYGWRIYVFGGKNNDEVITNCVQYYDTVKKSFTTLSCDLPANDVCLSAVLLNNYIYVTGLESCFRFSPDSENWDSLPDMSCTQDYVSLAVLVEIDTEQRITSTLT